MQCRRKPDLGNHTFAVVSLKVSTLTAARSRIHFWMSCSSANRFLVHAALRMIVQTHCRVVRAGC